ncbi:hypothetical protein HETIRDRAFT_478085 [Heterobasidion irregulare TC 32-1]|uniref:Uncharacterized protein n=1 Tax=Heterobasidion irregulare (strain TC 32-1) TaxID=747525 RepID=W4JZB5_HETIT|nr:uncharacterized protein HETIRDRAFT_478085 [Heterobasidion irregulare TC 32-1]ETW78794.1 hypothetical protein HETIRDRAFT_478085 [Heterobasidion irregulare TC 32-1]
MRGDDRLVRSRSRCEGVRDARCVAMYLLLLFGSPACFFLGFWPRLSCVALFHFFLLLLDETRRGLPASTSTAIGDGEEGGREGGRRCRIVVRATTSCRLPALAS